MRLAIFRWLVAGLWWPALVLAEEPLQFGVHPLFPSAELVERFTPLLDYLTSKTGREFRLRIAQDYDRHIHAIGSEQLDVAYLGPTIYVRMVERYGTKPLLARLSRDGQATFRGVIFARDRSPLRQLGDLVGKRFAFGDPSATMTFLIPRYMLQREGVPLSQLAGYQFLGNHQNIVLGVLMGEFDAGAVKDDVYAQYAGKGLRTLATSMPVSNHVYVASGKLADSLQQGLRQALYDLASQPEGLAILRRIDPASTGLMPGTDSDFDTLRTILKELPEDRAAPPP